MRAARAPRVVLGSLEIGQHAFPIPAGVSKLRPGFVVLPLSPDEDQPVDRARAAKTAASRPVELASSHVRFFVGIEAPIVDLVEHGFPVTDGNVDPEVVVLGAGLDQQNLVASIGAQAIGKYAAGRPGTDNDVVELANPGTIRIRLRRA